MKNIKIIKSFSVKILICFVIILTVNVLSVKIGGSFPNYPPIDKHPIPWNEVWLEIPRLLLISLFGSFLFTMGLYWDWYAKNKKSEEDD